MSKRLHINRVMHLVAPLQQVAGLVVRRNRINKSTATESRVMHDTVVDVLHAPILEELSALQDLNFQELLDACAHAGLTHVFLGNARKFFISESDLIGNCSKTYRHYPPIWGIANQFLEYGVGNGNQCQITLRPEFHRIGYRTLEMVYSQSRCGKLFCVSTGNEITSVPEIEQLIGRTFR